MILNLLLAFTSMSWAYTPLTIKDSNPKTLNANFADLAQEIQRRDLTKGGTTYNQIYFSTTAWVDIQLCFKDGTCQYSSAISSATDNSRVLKAGDTMTGQLTIYNSSLTVGTNILATSSVTAGAFFGDISHTTGGTCGTGTGTYSVLCQGSGNATANTGSTVGGGVTNSAKGYYSTISGGLSNSIDTNIDYATIGGGNGNVLDNVTGNNYSVIGGGNSNHGTVTYTTIGGGRLNTAQGTYSTVCGGNANNAGAGSGSTIGGGDSNFASGTGATVPGGLHNNASGNYSVAMGSGAISSGNGSFTFSDTQNAGVTNSVADRFYIQAQGGFFVDTNTDVSSFGHGANRSSFTASGYWQPVQISTQTLLTTTPNKIGEIVWATIINSLCQSTGTTAGAWTLIMSTNTVCK